ncbi:MAG: hypothetical protein R3C25_06745 [Hyphomonadaceae bacterium]
MESLIGFPGSVIARRGRVRDPFSTARVQAGAVEGFRAKASLDSDGRAGDAAIAHATWRRAAGLRFAGAYVVIREWI